MAGASNMGWGEYLWFAIRRAWRLSLRRTSGCWICGADANSSEHRFKKSDIVRVYGRGPYSPDSAPAHVSGAVVRLGQSPNAEMFKYAKSVCHECNTARTQPFDRAYEQFISWVTSHEAEVIHRRIIDLEDVYGADVASQQRNLFRYFAKSFGCRLVDAGARVPDDLIAVLCLSRFITRLRLTVAVDERLRAAFGRDTSTLLGKGDLVEMHERKHPNRITEVRWNEHLGWLVIHYWYGGWPDGRLGTTWTADAKHLYLGTIDNHV